MPGVVRLLAADARQRLAGKHRHNTAASAAASANLAVSDLFSTLAVSSFIAVAWEFFVNSNPPSLSNRPKSFRFPPFWYRECQNVKGFTNSQKKTLAFILALE